jgi:tuberous sclerosis protein 2
MSLQILSRPFEQYAVDATTVVNEVEVLDVKTVVTGLIRVFKEKLYQLPSSHAIKAYRLLVNHLESHYQKPAVFENTSSIRYAVSMSCCRT